MLGQADSIIIVDNGSNNVQQIKLAFLSSKVVLISLKENLGIAAASNLGAREAINLGADLLIFSDQDTVYPDDYRKTIESCFEAPSQNFLIVPQFFDVIKNELSPFLDPQQPLSIIKILDEPLTPILHAIASGMAMRCSTFKALNGFNEDLFIDWVDFEFCWRARNENFEVYCCRDLIIQHLLGDGQKSFFGRKITLRSWRRHYFMIRNELYLALFGKYTPNRLRRPMIFRSLRRFFFMPFLFPGNFYLYVFAGVLALVHAVSSRLGPISLRR